MKKSLFFIFACLFTLNSNFKFAQKDSQALISKLSNFQIDSMLAINATKGYTVVERMKFYSKMFLSMPYDLNCAGDGPYALYEPWPLVNFERTNCMVFCEHTLALSISDSWDNFFNNLQQIRYKDGIIGMRTRNHYTMADWLPENSWLLYDATQEIGGELAKPLTRTISHKKFFETKKITDMRYVKPDRTLTISYIPFSELNKVKNKIKDGDIITLIFANKDDIFAAHMTMAFYENDKLIIRESALGRKTTFDTDFDEWLKKYLNSQNYCGVSVIRLKEEFNKKNFILLPWDIKNYKK
jgi:hypothetical protein